VSAPFDLNRFVAAQADRFDGALAELRSGTKQGHWMWFIFPQLAGLGLSPTAKFYAIASLGEARTYLAHPLLGPRLRARVEALLPWADRRSAAEMLGQVDAMKLRSCLTLFDQVEPASLIDTALTVLFGGEPDARTLALLGQER
jgi:uncharacterized protein (DUF1810 family)